MRKIFVIGLDSAPPQIVFDRKDELPHIKYLIENGTSGFFRTTDPPITIPAWLSMVTGKDPGKMGLYGFRYRKPGTYNDMYFATSDIVKEPAIWDILKEKNMPSCLISIPPSYPPRPVNGNLISCFMTPGDDSDYTYPASLKDEIEKKFGKYKFDVTFRTEDRDKLLKELYDMTKQHFQAIKYLMQNKIWQFFMFVEIGIDRIHHAFWKYFDKQHHAYEPGNKYENAIMDYYKFIDKEIGDILESLDDNTVVFVVSDHGTKAMKGAFCINQWLKSKGYLCINKKYPVGTDLEKAEIDWSKTKVWAWGGYYARVFFNIKGREPKGAIPSSRYKSWRNRLKEEFTRIKGPNGEKWDTKVYKPEELYSESNGDKPDLIVYFDDLSWRAAGTIGHHSMYLSQNDKGPDDSVHDWYGIFIMYDPKNKNKKWLDKIDILDFAPTVLDIMDSKIPKDMEGRSVFRL